MVTDKPDLHDEIRDLREQLSQAEDRAAKAERDLSLADHQKELDASSAAFSELGAFILHKIGEVRTLPISEVAANLVGPQGWVAIGRLMKARLIDENGESFYVTTSGKQILAEIEAVLKD